MAACSLLLTATIALGSLEHSRWQLRVHEFEGLFGYDGMPAGQRMGAADTLARTKCMPVLEAHPEIGAAGLAVIDATGKSWSKHTPANHVMAVWVKDNATNEVVFMLEFEQPPVEIERVAETNFGLADADGDVTLTPYALCSSYGINQGDSVEVKASQLPKREL